jgi:hypothetical protein
MLTKCFVSQEQETSGGVRNPSVYLNEKEAESHDGMEEEVLYDKLTAFLPPGPPRDVLSLYSRSGADWIWTKAE